MFQMCVNLYEGGGGKKQLFNFPLKEIINPRSFFWKGAWLSSLCSHTLLCSSALPVCERMKLAGVMETCSGIERRQPISLKSPY